MMCYVLFSSFDTSCVGSRVSFDVGLTIGGSDLRNGVGVGVGCPRSDKTSSACSDSCRISFDWYV